MPELLITNSISFTVLLVVDTFHSPGPTVRSEDNMIIRIITTKIDLIHTHQGGARWLRSA